MAGAGILQSPALAAHPARLSETHTANADDLARIKALLNGKAASKWVFTGDSITQGAKHTLGYRSYPEIFGERVRFELGRVRDFIINTAISGHTSRDILNDYDWRIGQFNPTIVSLMIGTNDASEKKDVSISQFREYNLELVSRIRQSGAIPILQTPNIVIPEKAVGRERLEQYISVTREIAAQKNVVLIDHWNHWNEEIKSRGKQEVTAAWLNDELHPNGFGHLKMAHLVFRTLSIFDPNSPTCKDISKS
jgi:lysophospholipase L1-like esterase